MPPRIRIQRKHLARPTTARPNHARPSAVRFSHTLCSVDCINGPYDVVAVDDFRQRAFEPQLPLHIPLGSNPWQRKSLLPLPAIAKWFELLEDRAAGGDDVRIIQAAMAPSRDVLLPYELYLPASATDDDEKAFTGLVRLLMEPTTTHTAPILSVLSDWRKKDFKEPLFHRFNAPFSLLIDAWKHLELNHDMRLPSLYIAQAQLNSLPQELQSDLPTPHLVTEAGKGDIYDANIWLSCPPTYTPLHKDPNPNLFVQMVGSKTVRIFRPEVGLGIFRRVRQKLGQNPYLMFRGDEMMSSPEREVLEQAVWETPTGEGFEVQVLPGDALFIPKGWWHSIKSVGHGKNASVNWWFR